MNESKEYLVKKLISEKHKCQCGCNKLINIKMCHLKYGIPRYIPGHNSNGRPSKKRGIKSGLIPWNKGLTKETDERVKKYCDKLTFEKRSKILKKVHKNRTEEQKKEISIKIGLKHKGKKLSEETKHKISENNKRTKWSEERKRDISKRFSGKGNPFYGKKHSSKTRDKIRKNTLKYLQKDNFWNNKTNTSIEIKLKEELVRMGYKENIDFIHQFNFNNKFMCDFCFTKQKIIIETYGDFWHANPIIYKNKQLYPVQLKDIKIDKAKESYIKKYDNKSWKYLYFWETDINEDVSKCVDKIKEELIKNG
jgi:very-short-patch-repair endonuclease